MRRRNHLRTHLFFSLTILLLPLACGPGEPASTGDPPDMVSGAAEATTVCVDAEIDVVPCTDIEHSLADFSNALHCVEVENTNDSVTTTDVLNYMIVSENAESADTAILFIPGTAGVLPDWDVHMITNSEYASADFWPDPASNYSLCHEYALIFMDYPGVGERSSLGSDGMYFDNLSNDIDHILADAQSKYLPNVTSWNVVGWSLGSLTGLRYASWPGRSFDIDALAMFATKPGGGAWGNQAGCVTEATEYLADIYENNNQSPCSQDSIEDFLVKSIFPLQDRSGYVAECATFQPETNGSMTCVPKNEDGTETLAVVADCYDRGDMSDETLSCEQYDPATPCNSGVMCSRTMTRYFEARRDGYWEGGAEHIYIAQRDLIPSWNCCYNVSSGTLVKSECPYVGEIDICPDDGTSYQPENGGVCYCEYNADPSQVTCRSSDTFAYGCSYVTNLTATATFYGEEDLWIDSTFDVLLSESFGRGSGVGRELIASDTYPPTMISNLDGQSGHGTPMQYPAAYQDAIYELIEEVKGVEAPAPVGAME